MLKDRSGCVGLPSVVVQFEAHDVLSSCCLIRFKCIVYLNLDVHVYACA